MRIVLVDVASADGFVSKDTVAGGYGSRLRPFSRVTRLVSALKKRLHDVPSVQLGYVAALCADAGHEVAYSTGATDRHGAPVHRGGPGGAPVHRGGPGGAPVQPRGPIDGDVAIVLTSLVDHRRETAWADACRSRGMRVGFIGLAASKMPELFEPHGDFVILGEPETAIRALAAGHTLAGRVVSAPVTDLDSLPFPRWDLVGDVRTRRLSLPFTGRPNGGAVPVLASRGCPEFCTYCPHRILAGYRFRTIAGIVDELEHLTRRQRRPYVVFRDPLFTEDRDRCLDLCEAIRARGLTLRFECETRLDRLDPPLLARMRGAGLAAISFGVETVDRETLRRSGRRPIPEAHQQQIMAECRRLGIVTAAFYVFGFLQDDWSSIAATIEYAIALGSTVAQFKILTPYPGTPMWRQLASRVYETDWERFDGYTPTFTHPNLTADELRFLLGSAYTRFYVRPSWLTSYARVGHAPNGLIRRMDDRVSARHERRERAAMQRPVTC